MNKNIGASLAVGLSFCAFLRQTACSVVQSFVGAKFMIATCEVENIHKLGGSILVSDRGNPPHSEIAKARGRST